MVRLHHWVPYSAIPALRNFLASGLAVTPLNACVAVRTCTYGYVATSYLAAERQGKEKSKTQSRSGGRGTSGYETNMTRGDDSCCWFSWSILATRGVTSTHCATKSRIGHIFNAVINAFFNLITDKQATGLSCVQGLLCSKREVWPRFRLGFTSVLCLLPQSHHKRQ